MSMLNSSRSPTGDSRQQTVSPANSPLAFYDAEEGAVSMTESSQILSRTSVRMENITTSDSMRSFVDKSKSRLQPREPSNDGSPETYDSHDQVEGDAVNAVDRSKEVVDDLSDASPPASRRSSANDSFKSSSISSISDITMTTASNSGTGRKKRQVVEIPAAVAENMTSEALASPSPRLSPGTLRSEASGSARRSPHPLSPFSAALSEIPRKRQESLDDMGGSQVSAGPSHVNEDSSDLNASLHDNSSQSQDDSSGRSEEHRHLGPQPDSGSDQRSNSVSQEHSSSYGATAPQGTESPVGEKAKGLASVFEFLRSPYRVLSEHLSGISPRTNSVAVRTVNKDHSDFQNMKLTQSLSVHVGPIWTLKFSPDGRFLGSAGQDGRVIIWSVGKLPDDDGTSANVSEFEEEYHNNPSDDIARNAAAGDRRKHSSRSRTSGSQTDGAAAADDIILLWRLPYRIFNGHEADVIEIAWSRSNFVLSASVDKTVRLWHVSRYDHHASALSVAVYSCLMPCLVCFFS